MSFRQLMAQGANICVCAYYIYFDLNSCRLQQLS